MKMNSQITISTMISGAGICTGSDVENGRLHRRTPSVGRAFGKRPATSALRGITWPTEPEHPVVGSNVRDNCVNMRYAYWPMCDGSDGYLSRLSRAKQVSVLPGVKLRRLAASQAAPLVLSQQTPRG